jgi:hypothetical protein
VFEDVERIASDFEEEDTEANRSHAVETQRG